MQIRVPNITGYFGGNMSVVTSGAFSTTRQAPTGSILYSQTDNEMKVLMNAGNANGLYGSSSVVQPSSLRLIPCIKS